VNINIWPMDPVIVDYGDKGRLSCDIWDKTNGENLIGVPVILSPWSGEEWLPGPTSYTDEHGEAYWSVAPKVATEYAARTEPSGVIGYGTSYRATSGDNYYGTQWIVPRVRLTPKTDWSTIYAGKTYYATGNIEPKHSSSDSNKVKIRAYKKGSDGKYRYVKSFTASYSYHSSTLSHYKAAVKLTSRGAWKLVPYHKADSRNYETFGKADYVTVR
jgi:hypothetical protein